MRVPELDCPDELIKVSCGDGNRLAIRAEGSSKNLFLVLRIPTTTPFAGVSNLPPFIGLDGGVAVNDVPIFGLSYLSNDGVAWNQVTNFNFRFSLVLSALPPDDGDDDD